jgi:RNA polymerase sigma factor FliA
MSAQTEPLTDMPGQPGAGAPAAKYRTLDDEARLWEKCKCEQDEEAREVIVRHYLGYARALAAQIYRRRTHDEFEFDEYMQFATVGLMEAVNRFEPSYGVQFKTFATRRIVGSILSGLSTLSERQQQISLRRRICEERLASMQPERMAEDHPEHLLRELAEIGIGLALGFVLEGTGMVASSEASLPDNTYSRLEFRQFQHHLFNLVRNLTAREQEVIRKHYLQGISFEEIAQELQLSKGRVSQLHRQGLERLRTLILESGNCDMIL